MRSAVLSLCTSVGLAASAVAAPVNTTLPGGMSWQSLGTSTYDTGSVFTPRGGYNTQTSPPYQDTSYGVMNEPSAAWATGTDLSSQQYVQRQIFGNFGTSSPPGPSGVRYYNFGYTGPSGPTIAGPIPTSAGSNFPQTAGERRIVTLNHWNNTNPDAGGVATLNQIVYVPVSATLIAGIGYGADEMLLKAIGGGNSNNTSQFRIDININAAWNTSAFGGITNTNNVLNYNRVTQVKDPNSIGLGGSGWYDVAWGLGATGDNRILNQFTATGAFVRDQGVNVAGPLQGIPANSVGTSVSDSYNVLSSILQNGTAFSLDFNSAAEMFISREFGNADARGSMGPGMEGFAQLVVNYEAFKAIPAPGAGALLALGGLIAARRRRD